MIFFSLFFLFFSDELDLFLLVLRTDSYIKSRECVKMSVRLGGRGENFNTFVFFSGMFTRLTLSRDKTESFVIQICIYHLTQIWCDSWIAAYDRNKQFN